MKNCLPLKTALLVCLLQGAAAGIVPDPSCEEGAARATVEEWTDGTMVRDESVTMQRAAKGSLDDCPRWEVSYGNTRYYSIQDDEVSCSDTPPTEETWGYNSYSGVDRDFKKATITEGPCEGGESLLCTPLAIVPDQPYDVPENPCPRVWCVTTADALVSGEYWEDIKDNGETSGDFLRDGVPRYIQAKPTYDAFDKCDEHTGSASGDPHFVTWSGKRFDFHGGCDLVLLDNPSFDNGLGMTIHIRTSIKASWSFIDTAVVRIGDNSLEIKGGTPSFSLNQGERKELQTEDAALGDFAIRFRRINDHQSTARVDLGNGDAVSIETFKHFVRVNVKAKNPKNFEGTTGLMGSFPGGDMVARDNSSILEDPTAFGQEWQVLESEPKMFHDVSTVQHPAVCEMPAQAMTSEQQRRRLGESAISKDDAALACANTKEQSRDACIFDVLATNDKDMADSYVNV